MQYEYKTAMLKTGGLLGGKVDTGELESFLNARGKDGWELVTIFGTVKEAGRTRDLVAVFRRQVP